MPYAFDYSVTTDYGSSYLQKEERAGKGQDVVGAHQQKEADRSKSVTYMVGKDTGFRANTKWSIRG